MTYTLLMSTQQRASRCNQNQVYCTEDMTSLPRLIPAIGLVECLQFVPPFLCAYDVNDGIQVALLREKLAKEQQRARAAEATLAAQHQMQQLLQSAVQAVLLARSSAQVVVYACLTPTCVTLSVCMHEVVCTCYIASHEHISAVMCWSKEAISTKQYHSQIPRSELYCACCQANVNIQA